jgi:hypothetical protein
MDSMPGNSTKPIFLNVFFGGTSSSVEANSTQIEQFAYACDAVDISNMSRDFTLPVFTISQLKMCFDGCGVAFGTMGTIFGSGLSTQCQQVDTRIQQIIQKIYNAAYCIIVNAFGLSRGAVACLMLAKLLGKYESRVVSVNLLAFDPVPGNLITPVKYLDWLGFSNSWGNMDLTQGCDNLKSALVLYPHEPLPTFSFHAPMIPLFSPGVGKYDVILGCHQGAVWNYADGMEIRWTRLSFEIIRNFLESHGVALNDKRMQREFGASDLSVLAMMDQELQKNKPSSRDTHAYGTTKIVRKSSGDYLNEYHYRLVHPPQTKFEEADSTCLTLPQYVYSGDIPTNGVKFMLSMTHSNGWFAGSSTLDCINPSK